MNGRTKEQESLSWKFFQKAHFPIESELVADLLRQHAGINMLYRGEYFGHDITAERPRLERLLNPTPEEKDVLDSSRVWVGHTDSKTLPSIKLKDSHELSTPAGLVAAGIKIRKRVDNWVSKDSTGRRLALRNLLAKDPKDEQSLAYKATDILTTITTAFEQDMVKKGSPLGKSLGTVTSFIRQHVLPLTGISPEESKEVSALVSERRAGYMTQFGKLCTSRRFQEKIHAMIKRSVGSIGPMLLDEVVYVASSMNRIRMMERLEERGIDFVSKRMQVNNLLAIYPKEPPDISGELSDEYIEWFKAFIDIVAPISNPIYEIPHDSAYMLEQILRHHQASCAGKAYTLTYLLRTVGFDAVVSTSKYYATIFEDGTVGVNPSESGEHVLTSIRLPYGIVVNLDPSLDPYSPVTPLFSTLLHNATINIPTGQVETDAETVIQDGAEHLDHVYVLDKGEFIQYHAIGHGYCVIEYAHNNPQFDYLNFGYDLDEYRSTTRNAQHIDHHSILYTLSVEAENFPHDAETVSMLAEYLLAHYREIADLEIFAGDKRTLLLEAVSLLLEAKKYSPYYLPTYHLLAQIITIPDFYQGHYEERKVCLEADQYFRYVYAIPIDEIDQKDLQEQWIDLLTSHPEHFIEAYGSREAVDAKIRELGQTALARQNY